MLMMCGAFYMCLSVWAIVQMVVMAIMYKIESVGLIEDAEAHHAESVQDFIDKTRENYKHCARNCLVAAGIYILILASSFMCMSKAKKDEEKREAALLDDTITCTVEETVLTEKQKKKIK